MRRLRKNAAFLGLLLKHTQRENNEKEIAQLHKAKEEGSWAILKRRRGREKLSFSHNRKKNMGINKSQTFSLLYYNLILSSFIFSKNNTLNP